MSLRAISFNSSKPLDTTIRTINYVETDNLDSFGAFEGPEKLLEIWFAPSNTNLPIRCLTNGLKSISRALWEEMLDLIHCKVLSIIESQEVDAYLLSESSMFVFPHKIILKTCGTTTLLIGLARLLEIAHSAGFQDIKQPYRIFYSRKNFMFPDKQLHPHKSWRDEVECLDSFFDYGNEYLVGKLNGDHWYLYLTSPFQVPPSTPDSIFSFSANPRTLEDETLEILMTDLSPLHAQQFFAGDLVRDLEAEDSSKGHDLGSLVSDRCGLSSIFPQEIFPDFRVDSYLFDPCGFSANGVLPPLPGEPKNQGHYFTVHVTPEQHCSYASFETNVPDGPKNIVERVTNIFGPGRFCVTHFNSLRKNAALNRENHRIGTVYGYKRVEKIVYELDEYELVFACFEKVNA
ncbi:S-adenosylmethionine decarboxylase proenzyme [Neolecta irregularis DAH-3]|uniref:adenosylmethionine decarboxylase n=1 Tax=Neolecta irregularis (strain DAH-3) TaxID=1198029 RepID=A0A1U7LQX2_NEOID|nr:S-adenosylmethionine decarboxylase proenzyme [Neolecta irregularis DAH-3]|eukprot:OLL24952.1 S-adenosylmethionine decarboxylase proenzyme [Neolecta irregularis DAH-3]